MSNLSALLVHKKSKWTQPFTTEEKMSQNHVFNSYRLINFPFFAMKGQSDWKWFPIIMLGALFFLTFQKKLIVILIQTWGIYFTTMF